MLLEHGADNWCGWLESNQRPLASEAMQYGIY